MIHLGFFFFFLILNNTFIEKEERYYGHKVYTQNSFKEWYRTSDCLSLLPKH